MHYYKRWIAPIVVLLALGSLWGCSSESQVKLQDRAEIGTAPSLNTKMSDTGKSQASDSQMAKAATDKDKTNSTSERLSLPTAAAQRKVIYTANIKLTVKDYKQTRTKLEQIVDQHQGFLITSSESKNKESQSGNLTFRVPQAEFQSLLKELQKIGDSTPDITITGNDVTEELVDLESRLKAKKAMEKRLLDLMKQAKDTKDLLDISRQLDETQVEIEQIKGRLQYLNNKVNLATIHVQITQNFVPPSTPDQPLGKQMSHSFWSSLTGLGVAGENFLIFLAGAFPILLLLTLIGVPTYLFVRRHIQKKGV
ncbi:DUF4349 domain-containing protein [Paenactinomyces guangxiensis]|uniref:DUF4349 domain-containing protein n=1 Tax=Paenactinomyces guangxiensis TaxID=1490290 RepID=A0A7W1WPN4_9BACL|nr:DUF4349 domain-containing protein [Paenactinomyces guangxiensis]MBA4493710.1 DUF4349 domain-containing protein [Paenactinomyces guangxiensis]MBH8590997.1 DUF4349 domain-containing protein [Paenactinomyces guangxiensis]